jgi:hypothetical protein
MPHKLNIYFFITILTISNMTIASSCHTEDAQTQTNLVSIKDNATLQESPAMVLRHVNIAFDIQENIVKSLFAQQTKEQQDRLRELNALYTTHLRLERAFELGITQSREALDNALVMSERIVQQIREANKRNSVVSVVSFQCLKYTNANALDQIMFQINKLKQRYLEIEGPKE